MVHMFGTHIMQFSTFICISYAFFCKYLYQTSVECINILFVRLRFGVLQ